MKIYLIDRDLELISQWKKLFINCDDVEILSGDYFQNNADAIVSPANSFGIMDGGLDRAIRDFFGAALENRVQQMIERDFHGEMPVGCARFVETGYFRFPRLLVAPTMRSPQDVSLSLNAYIAFRAVLLAARNDSNIESIVCSGLCTGVGRMDPKDCALQMKMALNQVKGDGKIPDYFTLKYQDKILRHL